MRIAGVEVGKVKKIESAGERHHGLDRDDEDRATRRCRSTRTPTLKIRPRIFLEGNFFVDLQPGTPRRAELDPATRSRWPRPPRRCSSTRCSTTLQTDTRKDLQNLIQGYGDAINGKPHRGRGRDQDPARRGKTAAESLNDSLDYAPDALRGTALVNEALLGTEPHDLSKLIAGPQKVSAALVSREERAQGPDHELQHHHGGVRRRAGQPAADDRAAPAACSTRPTRRSTT